MKCAELDDVYGVKELCPKGDGEGHHHEGDDLGEEDPLEVAHIELLFGHDDEWRPGHDVSEPDEELADLVCSVIFVVFEHFETGEY